jgi:hypothetical protein
MEFFKHLQFSRKLETCLATGQELMKGLKQHIRECPSQPPMALVENEDNDVRLFVSGREILLAMAIEAKTSPESITGSFATYLVKRDSKMTEIEPIGRVWDFQGNGLTTGGTAGSFPEDFVSGLTQCLALKQAA